MSQVTVTSGIFLTSGVCVPVCPLRKESSCSVRPKTPGGKILNLSTISGSDHVGPPAQITNIEDSGKEKHRQLPEYCTNQQQQQIILYKRYKIRLCFVYNIHTSTYST